MKKRVFLAAVAALCIASVSSWSQVYVEFAAPTKQGNRPYAPIPAGTGTTILTASNFVTTPSVDPDNGFAVVTLPFTFEFNAVQYTNVAINVNGFIMFLNSTQPPLGLVGMELPNRLFDGQQFPRNVVAPFWGDHFFRVGGFAEPGYMPSQVLARQVTVGGRNAFCIEWRNLNINDKTLPSSVGNFQVFLYQQTAIQGNFQGDIEFAYGQIGGNPNTTLTTVITRNASVGMKGSSGSATIQADWINGLEFSGTQAARTSTRLTNSWQPSGGSDTVIVFRANPRIRLDVWGDGDADFSQAPGQRHNNNGNPIQNRFVTANDALTIMRSAATNVPLDSVLRTQAYKGDVDHNGRFYYSRRNFNNTADTVLYKREIRFRTASNDHTADMPNDNSLDYSLIYFQVNAYDAALIMHYLAGRITQLPWTIDSIVPFGKVTPVGRANNLVVGYATNAGSNTYRIPVYANGLVNGAVSAVFEMNGTVVNVETANPATMIGMFNQNRVAIAGTTVTNETTPIAYVTVATEASNLEFNNVEFNGDARNSFNVMLQNTTPVSGELMTLSTPNPFSSETIFNVNVGNTDMYTVSVYDVLGRQIKTLHSGVLNKGGYTFNWNGSDNNGSPVNNGMYVIRTESNGVVGTQNVVLTR